MRNTGYGRIGKPRIQKSFGTTTVSQRIRRKMRQIGFGFRKPIKKYGSK